MDFGELLVYVYVLNFVLLLVFLCFERRDPVVSLAWVLGFTVFPVLGFIVFIVFGTGLKRKTANKYAEKWLMNIDLSEKLSVENEKKRVKEYAFLPYANLISYLLNTNNSVLTDGNKVDIFPTAEEKFNRLLEDIKNAKDTINVLYFIIRDDEIGKKLISLLTEKAKSGVEVRLLYDDIGCFTTDKALFTPLKEAGGRVSAFFPLSIGTYSKINHRNHRKIVVIDGKVGYLGGINVGDEYYGKKRLTPWRDTHIRVVGPAVKYIQKAFSLDWNFSTGEDLSDSFVKFFPLIEKEKEDISMQIVCSGPDTKGEANKCAIIKMINNAKKYVYIQTPYFIPDQSFLNALKLSALGGVDVRIIIPGMPDKRYVYYSSLSYVGELLDAGIRVYTHKGFIHAKMAVADDDVCTIGTTNIDIRSFQLHFEINAFMYDAETACRCADIFKEDLMDCTEITPDIYAKRGVFRKLKEGFCRLFSPIM